MAFTKRLTLFLPVFWTVASGSENVQLPLATSAPSSASDPIPNNFQSFSIELAFWADYAGNHSCPNTFSNRLFVNLREFNGGVPQILRIGGNTQDHTTYIPDQKEGIINNWDYTYNLDQPRNSTIGPVFWESYNVITGTQYIPGLNFYKNDSDYLRNLQGEAQESLKYIPAERLHLLEIGNENDYGARSGFRPVNWTQEDYVEEWISRSRNIQTASKSLRFFAPSFCCFNITTDYSFFSPWTVWNSTFGYNRDGWIEEVSQHGYISSTNNNPTLQGTLMNHTNLINSAKPHVELNIFHRQNGRKYTVGETNSISGQGSHGVSDVFGSALWLVDYCLYLAAQSVTRIHLHQGTSYRYAAWLPIVVNGTGPLVKPPYYGHIFVAKFLGSSNTTQINNVDLGSDYYSAYAAYEAGNLSRVAILNLLTWDPPNSTDTSSSIDATIDRPKTTFNLGVSQGYRSATVELMTAPGATFDTNITVAGISYDYDLAEGRGVRVGKDIVATLQPGKDGSFSVDVEASQAVVVTFHR